LRLARGRKGIGAMSSYCRRLSPAFGAGQQAQAGYGALGQQAQGQSQAAAGQLGGLTGALGQLAGLYFGMPGGAPGQAPRPFKPFSFPAGGKY
jgi:hypothetical protein